MDPQQQQTQVPMSEPKKSYGPVIGIIVIILILVVGALYVWGGKLSNKSTDEAQTSDVSSNTGGSSVSSSDEVSAIQGDLESDSELEIDLSELDSI